MKRTRIITRGIVAGLALLGVTVLPAIAHEHNQTTSTIAQRQPATPSDGDRVQTAPTEEQMRQMIAQCNSMMSMMHNMMGNDDMSGMMEQQNNPSGQDMINQMPRQ
ncbi:hypothetical protein IQ238_09340 [Pleurocapsales cyanobacterium LEGE 06147]|nr:hypothetical protein [Pleurocapsales cyanobacterium LEGE 06147]